MQHFRDSSGGEFPKLFGDFVKGKIEYDEELIEFLEKKMDHYSGDTLDEKIIRGKFVQLFTNNFLPKILDEKIEKFYYLLDSPVFVQENLIVCISAKEMFLEELLTQKKELLPKITQELREKLILHSISESDLENFDFFVKDFEGKSLKSHVWHCVRSMEMGKRVLERFDNKIPSWVIRDLVIERDTENLKIITPHSEGFDPRLSNSVKEESEYFSKEIGDNLSEKFIERLTEALTKKSPELTQEQEEFFQTLLKFDDENQANEFVLNNQQLFPSIQLIQENGVIIETSFTSIPYFWKKFEHLKNEISMLIKRSNQSFLEKNENFQFFENSFYHHFPDMILVKEFK